MKYELVVVADTNDADTDTRTSVVTQEQLDELIPIIDKIRAKSERPGRYRWPTKERLRQGRYPSPQENYGLTDDEVELMEDEYLPYGDDEYGIHTIWSIEYYPLPEKVKLL